MGGTKFDLRKLTNFVYDRNLSEKEYLEKVKDIRERLKKERLRASELKNKTNEYRDDKRSGTKNPSAAQ